MLPAAQVVNGQAEVTYVLNNQSVAARLVSNRRAPMRAEVKCMRKMVPPIGSLTLFFAALQHSIFRKKYMFYIVFLSFSVLICPALSTT